LDCKTTSLEEGRNSEAMTSTDLTPLDRARGCLLGLAAGDAVGTTLEFRSPGSFEPIDDMVGGGPFELAPGEWTDDTSLALCLAESLVACRGFDALDQAQRYLAWWETGKPGPKDHCFDIGTTTSDSLDRFRESGNPVSDSADVDSAGNGSLMRLAPIPICYSTDLKTAVDAAGESSRVTHAAEEAVDACRAYAAMLLAALGGADREAILATPAPSGPAGRPLAPAVVEVMEGSWRHKSEGKIVGSGYVVEALEAAIWCFANTQNYREAILRAANLGDDADTTAAICGQLAGAYYGASGIPEGWRAKLFMGDAIEALATQLYEQGEK
jgi:ADP-ribosyl-[dinitrogen reductase] hydrolase